MKGNLQDIMIETFRKTYGHVPEKKEYQKPKKSMYHEFLKTLYNGDKEKIKEQIIRDKRIHDEEEANRKFQQRLQTLEQFELNIPKQFKNKFIETLEYKRYENQYFKENKDLIFMGPIQKGKSRYAVEIGRKNIALGGNSIFLPLIECSLWSPQDFTDFLFSLQQEELVILDDFVEKSFLEQEWLRKKVRPLIKSLFSKNVKLIITMNNTIEDVKAVWDEPNKPLGKISERMKDVRFFINRSLKGNIIPIKGYKK